MPPPPPPPGGFLNGEDVPTVTTAVTFQIDKDWGNVGGWKVPRNPKAGEWG